MCEKPRPRPPVLNRSRRLLIDAMPHLMNGAPVLALEVARYLAGCLGTRAKPDGPRPGDPTPAEIQQRIRELAPEFDAARGRAVARWPLPPDGLTPEAAVRAAVGGFGARDTRVYEPDWHWAKNFVNPEDGRLFVAWLHEAGADEATYYRARPDHPISALCTDGVRYRLPGGEPPRAPTVAEAQAELSKTLRTL